MSRVRRTSWTLALLAAAGALLLFVLLDTLGGYAEKRGGGGAATAPSPETTRGPDPGVRPSAAQPAQGTSVRGRVLFDDGTPAQGATLQLRWEDRAASADGLASRTADAGGAFGFDLPEDRPGARADEVSASIGPLGTAFVGDVTGPLVLRLPESFTLAGRVLAADDRSAVQGATVAVSGRSARADAAGRFRLGSLPAAIVRAPGWGLDIAADGFLPARVVVGSGELPAFYEDLTLRLQRR